MKILITGDRNWTSIERVVEEFKLLPEKSIIVEGGCKGADLICRAVAESFRFVVKEYPADWKKFGRKKAGPIRNREMVKFEHKDNEPIDLCLAFHNDIENSKGTKDMLNYVKEHTNIKWKLCTESDTTTAIISSTIDAI